MLANLGIQIRCHTGQDMDCQTYLESNNLFLYLKKKVLLNGFRM